MPNETFVCENLSVNEQGHLTFAGQDVTHLAAEYGTPLYLMDEDRIRHKCRIYREAFEANFAPGSTVLYASKACSFRQIYRIVNEEGLGADVVSLGELCTALSAGFPADKLFFHSNNKTDEDIRCAIEKGIGCFVVDNLEEIRVIEAESARLGRRQKVLLRLTPGIDTHTYEAVNTGKVDSKFGSAIETGQAEQAVVFTLAQPHVELLGFHCHVGSQVFAEDVFECAAVVMLEFIAAIREKHGYTASVLNLGGGYGVPYTDRDGSINIAEKIADVGRTVRETCARLALPEPVIYMEPGRSIVADAGLTLYTVGTVKTIPGYKNYVSVDGGMTDNPRYALYGSEYTCLTANKLTEEPVMKADLVGRCCESGDVIQPDVAFPDSIRRGDIVAVCTTGAYNYSMASNYNRIPRPPVVLLHEGTAKIAVRRETLEDLMHLDV
ncbi:MAG: diaminopimelate decarboxylase [Oscillospiraceae bacterium]|nr:diaminopimelate decarboxylase [Oscillospiraceae bacterium]